MSDTETEDRTVTATPPPFVDDATSETDVEPPSPGNSLKGLYVRSRPTSMDGSIIEFPTNFGLRDDVDFDFTPFGMTRPPIYATTPNTLHFPLPPHLGLPPPGKKRRYATSMKSLYTGTGTGTSLKTNRAPIVPLQAVPRVVEEGPATPLPPPLPPVIAPRERWDSIKKIVPGLFRRHTARPLLDRANDAESACATATAHTQPTASFSAESSSSARTRGRALSIRSFKSSKSKGKMRAAGIENVPLLPVRAVPATPRPRVHSFSGYLADSELVDEEDETDAEMTAVHLEALATVLKLNERFEFAVVDPEEIGVAL
ncbi:hypothetical protein K438DRAFT_2171082 [Mycena galopus ATCC 62051]|nr:hypothetical protein K438DRAFT_2171082 [Mycena galopus ATCC 62051]